jgi:hypothetical protein
MSRAVDELWSVVRVTPEVDPGRLARAVEGALSGAEPLDYRTRLLIRDSVAALEGYWGAKRFGAWVSSVPDQGKLREARQTGEDPEEVGFPSLARRLMDEVTPEQLREFLRELAGHVTRPTKLVIGGSASLILGGFLLRHTDDLDVVDEVPAELRAQHGVLEDLVGRYGLQLAHFQSHYLNEGWEKRIHSAGVFGGLHVFLVDPYDVFVGKLFSVREKDRDDLRMLKRGLDRETIVGRLLETGGKLRTDLRLAKAAADNWFVVFGEKLPE